LVLGDAGHGNTTLTEKVGRHNKIVESFGARRWFVELQRADSAEGMLAAIAEAIGLERTAPQYVVETRLAAKPALVILDNLETPLHADRDTRKLLCDLTSIHGLALIASLRGRVTVAGVPWSDQICVEPLPFDVAKKVFLSITFTINENDPDLDFFLTELAGIPLAIRLVAQRASAHDSLAELRRQWEQKGALLAAEPGGRGSRRDSLLASVEFSLASNWLHETGRRLFSLLGQLPAGLAPRDLDVLLGDDGDDAAYQLRQVGLLKHHEGRIDLLAPIRDISHRCYRPDEATMRRAAAHFLSLIAEHSQRIGKDGGREVIARITPEMPNIGAAILASINTPKDRAKAVSILHSFGNAVPYTGIASFAVFDALELQCARAGEIVEQAKCRIARADIARIRSMNKLAHSDFCAAVELLTGREETKLEADCLWGRGLRSLTGRGRGDGRDTQLPGSTVLRATRLPGVRHARRVSSWTHQVLLEESPCVEHLCSCSHGWSVPLRHFGTLVSRRFATTLRRGASRENRHGSGLRDDRNDTFLSLSKERE
jgi:hypothetical protein